MKFNENLTAIHSYLSADGCVIKNPSTQKLKYYRIDFRNTNDTLLKDFQEKFYNYFYIKPNLYLNTRCSIGSKEIYWKLINQFGSFYSKEWKMPMLNGKLTKIWLRAFFDCEGWVFCKSHQNRHIGIDSVNEKGLDQIKEALENLGIKSIKKTIKNGRIYRLFIYGKENLIKFQKEIGFLHPSKKELLEKTILDFVDYDWHLKQDKGLIKNIMLKRVKIKKPYIVRVISKKKDNLDKLSKYLNMLFSIEFIKINERVNGIGTKYFELNVNKKDEVKKLIMEGLINEEQSNKVGT